MPREKLSPDAIDAGLAELKGWTLAGDGRSIRRKFEFKNFSEAFAFMTRCALALQAQVDALASPLHTPGRAQGTAPARTHVGASP